MRWDRSNRRCWLVVRVFREAGLKVVWPFEFQIRGTVVLEGLI
jgi:hypothetical protein